MHISYKNRLLWQIQVTHPLAAIIYSRFTYPWRFTRVSSVMNTIIIFIWSLCKIIWMNTPYFSNVHCILILRTPKQNKTQILTLMLFISLVFSYICNFRSGECLWLCFAPLDLSCINWSSTISLQFLSDRSFFTIMRIGFFIDICELLVQVFLYVYARYLLSLFITDLKFQLCFQNLHVRIVAPIRRWSCSFLLMSIITRLRNQQPRPCLQNFCYVDLK